MHRPATRSPKEQSTLERFDTFYERARSPVMAAIERQVCGCDYGGNSWTTRDQAEQMASQLKLRHGVRLLELGAGSGWPGIYIAETSGCDVVLVDIPLAGLQIAAQRAAKDGVAGNISIAAADAAALPFPGESFHAVSHSDLLCCLEQKRSVLAGCRRVVRRDGTMVFTVISVASGLSTTQYRRAVANGPDFIETDTDYGTLLAQTGWLIEGYEDVTAAYAGSCERQIRADESHRAGLAALLGAKEYAERLADWRSKLVAINDGLLRRERFIAAPNPERAPASNALED